MGKSVSAADDVQLSIDRCGRGLFALTPGDVALDVASPELDGPFLTDDRLDVLLNLAPEVGQRAVLVVDIVLDDQLAQIGNRQVLCPQADELPCRDFAEIVPNLVEGGRAAVLKLGSLRESSKPFTTKENRREETISHSRFRKATASQPPRSHSPAQPKRAAHAALG